MSLYRLRLQFAALAAALLLPLPFAAQSTGYDQPFRPQVHFSPQANWTNDPNGLVFFHGEYHLFYQYNPFGDQWGHMSWGHAVSRDLMHWQELPVAIPERDGVMIFTGSVVVDHADTSGLCKPGTECLVAVYTGYQEKTPDGPRQHQNLAYSNDDGRTWTRYEANPVLDLKMADFRDPSVSWDEQAGHWLMAVSLPKEHKVRFYASPDLKQWSQLSDFGPAGDTDGDWECPDLLRIPGEPGQGSIWALKVGLNPGAPQGGSGEQYFLGSFNGKQFTAQAGAPGWTNYGKDDYCAISYNGLPPGQKPVLIGWMSNWQYGGKLPTSPWRGQMSVPRRLSFLKDRAGTALTQTPILAPVEGARLPVEAEVGKLPGKSRVAVSDAPYALDLRFETKAQKPFGLRLYSDAEHWTEVAFDRAKAEFSIDRTRSGGEITAQFPARTVAPLVAGRPYDLELVVDRSSVEAFAQQGTIAMTDLIFAPKPGGWVEVFSTGGETVAVKGRQTQLNSIWK